MLEYTENNGRVLSFRPDGPYEYTVWELKEDEFGIEFWLFQGKIRYTKTMNPSVSTLYEVLIGIRDSKGRKLV